MHYDLCVACEEGFLFSRVTVVRDRNLVRQGQIYSYLGSVSLFQEVEIKFLIKIERRSPFI